MDLCRRCGHSKPSHDGDGGGCRLPNCECSSYLSRAAEEATIYDG